MLKSLYLRNWCLHKDREFKFQPGLNGILGSNGSGKSTILSALAFVLTGSPTSYGNKLDNLSWGTKTGYVELVFEVDGISYTIRRAVEKSAVRLTGPSMELTRATEVEAKVTELFGATPQVLLNNVFASQGEIDKILYEPPSARLKELQQTFGLGRQDTAYRALSIEATSYKLTPGLQQNYEKISAEVVAAREQFDALSSEASQLAARAIELRPAQSIVDAAAHAEEYDRTLQSAQKRVTETSERLVTARQNAETSQAAGSLAESRLVTLTSEASLLCDKIASVKLAKAELDDLVSLETRSETLKAQQAALEIHDFSCIPTWRARLQELESDLNLQKQILQGSVERARIPAEVKAQQDLLETEYALKNVTVEPELKSRLDQVIAEAKQLQEFIDKFNEGICPTCGQPVGTDDGHDNTSRVDNLRKLLDLKVSLEQEIAADLAAQKLGLTNKIVELKAFLSKCEATWSRIQRTKTDAVQVERDKVSMVLTDMLAKEQKLRAIKEELSKYVQALSRKSRLESTIGTVSLDALTSALSFNSVQQDNCRKQRESAKLAEQALQLATNESLAANTAYQAILKETVRSVTPMELQKARQDIEELSAVEVRQHELTLDVGASKARLDVLLIEARRLGEILKAEARDAAWADVVQQARHILHVTELPAALMREHGKHLNSRIQYYLQSWEAQFRMWLDEEMAFSCEFTDGRRHEAFRLSGGQKIVASTSFRFAMADLFARRTGVLVLDEPSTALDSANVVHLQKLLLKLKEMTGRCDRQIILVTHEASLMSFLEHVIEL